MHQPSFPAAFSFRTPCTRTEKGSDFSKCLDFFFFFLQCWGGVDALGITLLGHTLSDDRGKPLSISANPTMMGWPGAG